MDEVEASADEGVGGDAVDAEEGGDGEGEEAVVAEAMPGAVLKHAPVGFGYQQRGGGDGHAGSQAGMNAMMIGMER